MFEIGQCIFIRTVTYHLVGRIVSREHEWLILADASWVADSGRFGEAIRNGTIRESEYVGDAAVNLSAATDAFPWRHDLPTKSL